MNSKYQLKSTINDSVFFSDDITQTREIEGVLFYVVRDEKNRNLLVRKDSVKVITNGQQRNKRTS